MHHKGYKNRAFGVWTRGKRLFRSNRARCEVHRVCWNRSVCGRGVAAMLPSVNSQILIPAECPNARAPRAPVLRHAEAGSNAGIVPEPKPSQLEWYMMKLAAGKPIIPGRARARHCTPWAKRILENMCSLVPCNPSKQPHMSVPEKMTNAFPGDKAVINESPNTHNSPPEPPDCNDGGADVEENIERNKIRGFCLKVEHYSHSGCHTTVSIIFLNQMNFAVPQIARSVTGLNPWRITSHVSQ